MSSNNPLKTVESPEKQREESPGEPTEPRRNVDPARVEELENQVSELEEQLAGVEGEGEETEEEEPEPDYECSGEDCEGFAVEEIEPDHVTTQKRLVSGNDLPKRLKCPHCGEDDSVKKVVPKEEQKTPGGGGSPVMSSKVCAGRKVREDFQEAGQEDVLKEADSQWLA